MLLVMVPLLPFYDDFSSGGSLSDPNIRKSEEEEEESEQYMFVWHEAVRQPSLSTVCIMARHDDWTEGLLVVIKYHHEGLYVCFHVPMFCEH